MNYQECLDFLYSQLPMYQRDGSSAFKKDLTNTIALCQNLGNPQDQFRSIHVAGTNGKGSVCYLIAAMLQAEGYHVGVYTSPHYVDFRERIRIDGKFITSDAVLDFMHRIMPVLEKIQPSFFELTVAMAFDYFARQKVDFAVIETGLGGRLDSTNILNPMISVITNISLDHQSMLGDTLAQIAGEKAGIIKRGVPVVIGEKDLQTHPVFEGIANDRQATLVYAQEQLTLKEVSYYNDHFRAIVETDGIWAGLQIQVGLMGHYQILNVATALTTMKLLCSTSGLCISEKSMQSGLAEVVHLTGIQGRWQKLRETPLIIADSGHNFAGLNLAMNQLKHLNPRTLRIVFGVSRDKDYRTMLALLPVDAIYYWSAAALPRSLNPLDLQTEASRFLLKGMHFTSVKDAVFAAVSEADDEDVIFIGGSSFVVGEALTLSF